MKCGRIVLYGSIALLAAAQAWAVGPKAREQGVASYMVAEKDGDKQVSLRGNGGREIGQIAVHELKNSLLLELTQPGRAHLQIEWDFAVGRISVRDLDSGESAQAFAFPGKRAASSPEDPLLLRYRPQVEMAFEALHDVGLDKIHLTETFHKHIRTVRRGQGGDLARLLAKDEADPSCTGNVVRGTFLSGTRSGCCEGATDDANGQCSNGACWGCCSLLSCDAFCVLGDYGCRCGVTGTACAYTPPPPPPPSGGGGTVGGGGVSCNEGDLVTPEQCVDDCGGYVDGEYCDVP